MSLFVSGLSGGDVFGETFPPGHVCSPGGSGSFALDSEAGRQFVFHTLSALLCAYSRAFGERVLCLAPADVDTDLPYHVMPALQTYIHFVALKEQVRAGRKTRGRLSRDGKPRKEATCRVAAGPLICRASLSRQHTFVH